MHWLGLSAFAAAAFAALPYAQDDAEPEFIEELVPFTQAELIAIFRDHANRMTVPVEIGGKGPFTFLIDTGSERTVIGRHITDDLALSPSRRAKLVGLAGTKIVDTVDLPMVSLGSRGYPGIEAPLLEYADIGADGILGLDGLQNQRILFDFQAGHIAVEDSDIRPPTNAYEIVVRARRKSGQLILTDATVGIIRVNVIIDTGAQGNVGNRALQKKLSGGGAKGLDNPAEISSVMGQRINADAGWAKDFRIGRVRFDQIPVAFADSPAFTHLGYEEEPTIMLGMQTLRHFDRIAIDFKRRRVYFDLPADTNIYRDNRHF